jgi:uncharacterized membrane protein
MDMENENKQKKKFNFIVIYIIGFIISIIFEFYWINYYPYDYFMLFGIGIILCIFGYLSIDGVLDMVNQTLKKRDEQNEIMIKASKAIYLTTKRIALDGTPSLTDATDTTGSAEGAASGKDINSLVQDLARANKRLAREVQHAVSIQSLVKDNEKLVQDVQAAMQEAPESSQEVEVSPEVEMNPVSPEIEIPDVSPEIVETPQPSPEHETPEYKEHILVEHPHADNMVSVTPPIDIVESANETETAVETESAVEIESAVETETAVETENAVETETEDAMISEIENNLKANYDMPDVAAPDTPNPQNNEDDNQQLTADEIAELFANL